jgi:hypothetical protein
LYLYYFYIFYKNNILRIYIMALIVGQGPTRYATTISNRTAQSGGSVGGIKKSGTWGGTVYMAVGNVGNAYTYAIPQRLPSLASLYINTTRHPVQYNTGGYAVSHSGMM